MKSDSDDAYDPDELLDHVDQWKFKLHEKLARMTPAQRAAFWKSIGDEARKKGLNVIRLESRDAPRKKRTQRATG